MFIAARCTIAGARKEPRCSKTNEGIQKSWYICTMEYYSTIKRMYLSLLMRWMNLEPITQSGVSQKETHIVY